MSITPTTPAAATSSLNYARAGTFRRRPPRRIFYRWLLPVAWLPGSIGSCIYYGDEFGAFAAANLPGLLAVRSTFSLLSDWFDGNGAVFIAIVAAGLVLMTLAGFLLDVFRVSHRVAWGLLVIPVAAGITTIVLGLPGRPRRPMSLEDALPGFFIGWCWFAYFFAGFAIILAPIANWFRARRYYD